MLKLYPENYEVRFEVPFTDNAGNPFLPSGCHSIVSDGDDVVIFDYGQIWVNGADGTATVTVSASDNALGEGELSAVRKLKVTLSDGQISTVKSFSYIIEAEARLEILNNTFISLETAQMTARNLPTAKAWAAASEDQQIGSLIQAYSRLQRVQLRFPLPIKENEDRDFDERDYQIIRPGQWSEISKPEFLAMPREFRYALRAAQICEANVILSDNPVTQRHRNGVISETIGESSVMLRGGKLELGVDNETMRHLAGFIYYDVRVTRG